MRPIRFGGNRSVSNRYLKGLAAEIGKIALIVLATIEAVFLCDVIVSRFMPELMALGAGVPVIALVVAYSVPNGLFIALPTALLIAVYIVVLRRRENNEFGVFAGLGYSHRILSIGAVMIGLSGAILSLVLSGFVEPPARFLLASTLEQITYKAVRDGELAAGRFYQIGDTTFYATSGRMNKVAGDVFLYQKSSEDTGRVIVASQLLNPQADDAERSGVLFNNVNIYEFADTGGAGAAKVQPEFNAVCPECGSSEYFQPLSHMYFDRFYMELPKVDLPSARDWLSPNEADFFELFSAPDWGAAHVQVFGERLMRAVLCLVTPLMALVAVAMTSKKTLLFCLPLASGIVLMLSFFASSGVGIVSSSGLLATTAVVMSVAVMIAVACTLMLHVMSGRFVRKIGVVV
ncbi:LptF/LptG family permease [Hoeflea sp.]|uniref:LptF/LptG family permease n=1 Tax=Hoeflea sp. TaxID=1940281 RepID=UPI003BB13FFB